MSANNTYNTSTWTIAAGAAQDYDVGGNYLACLASNMVSFAVALDGGRSMFMSQGIKLRTPAGSPFQKITIDNSGNGSPLTVTMAYGQGDMTDARLSVSGTVNDNISEIGGSAVNTGTGASGAGTQRVAVASDSQIGIKQDGAGAEYIGRQGGSTFYVNPGAAGYSTIVAPASNVSGLWVRHASINNTAGSGQGGGFIGATVAPTAWNQAGAFFPAYMSSPAVAIMPEPVWLPPGVGLYFAYTAAAVIGACDYDLGA